MNPVVPAGANESLKKHLDAMTTNQDVSQLDSTRSRLMEEARNRYLNDPKMLADFEKMIGQDIDRRKTYLRVPGQFQIAGLRPSYFTLPAFFCPFE